MKLSDYIVEYFYKIGIKDYFGYQGTMIAHFIDSIGKNENVKNHVCYNEQGAAFEAVGYMKASGKNVCAYSTSGPGATNLITGIADAYYDSVPVIFITGQLNTYEYNKTIKLRQQGFQEADIVSIVKPITKYVVQITKPEQIAYEIEKAIYKANEKRPGPVLIDIPMDIQRAEIDVEKLEHYKKNNTGVNKLKYIEISKNIIKEINESKRPILLLGNGINKDDDGYKGANRLINSLQVPVLYSMPAKTLIAEDNKYNFGFVGTAYGQRYANLIACKKADLIVSLGCRMNSRTIGINRSKFNPDAKIIRVDIDKNELKNKINSDDINYECDVNYLIQIMNEIIEKEKIEEKTNWLKICTQIKERLMDIDKNIPEHLPNEYIEIINDYTDENTNIFVDVGQNQIWAAHSIKLKKNQKIIFSGGLGAMGFALPASIGGCIAKSHKTFAIMGDGGLQMNIQELELLKVENLPVTLFVFNNNSLGLIHQQQEDFFESKFYGACKEGGYVAPDFKAIGEAYGINSYSTSNKEEFQKILETYDSSKPTLIEIRLDTGTKAYPKTHFGNSMINQKPELGEELLEELIRL